MKTLTHSPKNAVPRYEVGWESCAALSEAFSEDLMLQQKRTGVAQQLAEG